MATCPHSSGYGFASHYDAVHGHPVTCAEFEALVQKRKMIDAHIRERLAAVLQWRWV